MKDKKGIALIMAIGVLAVLVIVATSFALSMRLEYKAASNYYNGVKANYNAEAALERAIYDLKTHVSGSAFDDLTEPWSEDAASGDKWDVVEGSTSGGISVGSNGTAYVTILDEQRKVNVNTANQTLLENLFVELGMPAGDATAVYNKINNNRPANGYIFLQELISIAGLTEVTGGEYETIRDHVTVTSYVDDTEPPIIIGANTGRAPINVNTCDVEMLRSVLKGLNDGTYSISDSEAQNVADDIINGSTSSGGTDGRPFSSWSDFEDCLDGSVGDGLSTDDAILIMNNCNPNRTSPVAYTTEFCFNSGGYYEITGTGTIGPTGQEIATREIQAIVRIYDIYTQTTKDDFRDEDLDGDNSYDASLDETLICPFGVGTRDFNEDGDATDTSVDEDLNKNGQFDNVTWDKVTWLDSCPVDSTDLFGSYGIPSGYEIIPNSLKLGYWDDFELLTEAYTVNELQRINQYWILQDRTGDGDLELYSQWPSDYGKYALYGSRWTFGDFALRVFEKDAAGGGPKDQAWILFRGIVAMDACLLLTGSGNLWWGTWGNKIWAWQVNNIDPADPTQRLMDDPIEVQDAADRTVDKIYYANDALAQGGVEWFPPLNQRYPYPDILRLWPNSNLADIGNWNVQSDLDNQPVEYYTPHALSGADGSDSKTFNLLVQGSTVEAYVYTPGGGPGGYLTNSFHPVNIKNATGRIGLYGQALYPCWDDLRIIPNSGTYTSKNLRPVDIDSDVDYDVNWCTIVATRTVPSSVADPTWVTITLETRSGTSTPPPTTDIWRPVSGDESDSLNGTYIQYRATLSTSDPVLQETPVLEDIVITYLPRTNMASYTLSP